MKDTGVIRRIDDLGRVVIPKEIRRTLKIREGDSLEIYTLENGSIALKKYSPLGDLSTLAKFFSKATLEQTEKSVVITDTERIISIPKSIDKSLENQKISFDLERIIEAKQPKMFEKGFRLTEDYTCNEEVFIVPIVVYGDVMGAIIMLDERISEEDKSIIKIGSSFFGEYIGS